MLASCIRRCVVFMFLNTASVLGFSQDFLRNDDYLYGVGMSKKEDEASDAAMLSLSRAIRTHVINETQQSVKEDRHGLSSDFSRTASLNSSIQIDGAKKYVTRSGKQYVVYYYFNKKRYVEGRLARYFKCLEDAKEYEKRTDAHAVNLVLGSYFRAYDAIDTEVMDALYPNAISMKKNLLGIMKRFYEKNRYQRGTIRQNGYYEITDYGGKEIPMIEYCNDMGEWVLPKRVRRYNDEQQPVCTGESPDAKNVVINLIPLKERYSIKYRLLYEEELNGEYVRIYVPEEFYLVNLGVRACA